MPLARYYCVSVLAFVGYIERVKFSMVLLTLNIIKGTCCASLRLGTVILEERG